MSAEQPTDRTSGLRITAAEHAALPVEARTVELLTALGTNQVAATLLTLGCFGVQGSHCACPIAVYLLRSDLRPVHVRVLIDRLFVTMPGLPTAVMVLVPAAVAAFTTLFDTGRAYSDLWSGPVAA